MKIETWIDTDNPCVDRIDHIDFRTSKLYICLSFYPVKVWSWEWAFERLLYYKGINFEFPSFSLLIMKSAKQ